MAFKRVINIAQGAEPGEVMPVLFEHPEEKPALESTG